MLNAQCSMLNAWMNIKAWFRIVMLCSVSGNQIHWAFISNKQKPQKPFEQTLIKNRIHTKSSSLRCWLCVDFTILMDKTRMNFHSLEEMENIKILHDCDKIFFFFFFYFFEATTLSSYRSKGIYKWTNFEWENSSKFNGNLFCASGNIQMTQQHTKVETNSKFKNHEHDHWMRRFFVVSMYVCGPFFVVFFFFFHSWRLKNRS